MAEYIVSETMLTHVGSMLREVVRCRECRWFGPKTRTCRFQPIEPQTVLPDHFCARGERRRG